MLDIILTMSSEGNNRALVPQQQLVRAGSAQNRLYLVCRKVLDNHERQGRPPTKEDLQQLVAAVSCLTPTSYSGYSDNPRGTTTAALITMEPSPSTSTRSMETRRGVSEEHLTTNLDLFEGPHGGYLPMIRAQEDEQESEPLIHRSPEEHAEQPSHCALLVPNRDEENPDSTLLVESYNNSNNNVTAIPKSPWLGPFKNVLIVAMAFASGVYVRDLTESVNKNTSCHCAKTRKDERQSLVQSCAAVLSGLKDDEFDPASPQYRATNWFLGPFGHEIAIPMRADKDFCKWDSEFGMLYALMVVRESLAVHDIDWYASSPSRVCHWPRIKCNDKDQVMNLVFNNAQLEGSLPAELAGLVHLEKFHAFTNPRLSGNIPTQLGSLSHLTSLELHETGLEGSVPSEICQLREHGNLTDLRVDTSRVACSCCDGDSAGSSPMFL